MKPPTENFGKLRVYQCSCGVKPHRPLKGPPKRCDECFAPLDNAPYQICDYLLVAEDLLRQARGEAPNPER